jgi:serine/threonine protein phosphatase PrpC
MISGAHAVVGSVGTTRCYLVRAGGVDRLAIDPARGSDVSCLACEPGAVYVMCSAGVWSVIDASRLTAAVAETDSSDALCDRLVGAAGPEGDSRASVSP